LDILPNGHGTQNIEKDEAAISHVIAREISVTNSLYPVDWSEWKLRDNSTIKYGIEHGKQRSERKTYCKH